MNLQHYRYQLDGVCNSFYQSLSITMAWDWLQENKHGVTASYIKSFPDVARLLGLEPLDTQAARTVRKLAKERKTECNASCRLNAGKSV